MTNEQINIAVAKLDGWNESTRKIPEWKATDYNGGGEYVEINMLGIEKDGAWKVLKSISPYSTSYDAIMPVIQRQPLEIRLNMTATNSISFMVSPRDLCIALLKSKGLYDT